jgi:hypothetical protein
MVLYLENIPLASMGEKSTLILNKDQSFQQELSRAGKIERTPGALGDGLAKAALCSQRSF